MIRSKLNATGATTIPEPVRSALGIGAGDELDYVLEDGRVIVSKVAAASVLDSAAEHDADREIYGDPSRAGC